MTSEEGEEAFFDVLDEAYDDDEAELERAVKALLKKEDGDEPG